MPKTATQPVAGTWVHPADGDDYPEELTMRVSETRMGPNACTAWDTKEVHADGDVLDYQFVHINGARSIFFAHRIPEGWSPITTMAQGRWDVVDGRTETAREMIRDFFTVGGYERTGP